MAAKARKFRGEKDAAAGILILALAALLACPAHADDDPFEMDSNHWMSFDHYKDASKRGSTETPPPAADTNSADNNAATAARQTPAPAQTVSASAAPAVAAPTRPIDLPVMPGMNKGMGLEVSSTEDQKPQPGSTPVISTDAPPDIHLPTQAWQTPIVIGHARKQMAGGQENGDGAPLDVRMTYLPDARIEPVASPEHASAQSLTNAIAMQHKLAKKAEDPRTATEKSVCAAIDAYKKQQLDAIQSDRQTLKALQDAISSLGLQKQLDFMTGKDSALNTPAGSASSNIDLSAPTTIR